MWFLEKLLFESVLYWGIFSFLLFAIVLLTRPRSTGAYRRWALPGVLCLIALLFLLQKIVTTERERILASLDVFITGVTQEKERDIAATLSRDYNAEEFTHDQVVEAIMRALGNLDIYDVRYRQREVTFNGDSADMKFGVMASVRIGNEPATFHSGRWRIAWKQEPGQWRIVSIRPEMIDGVPITRIRTLLRHYQ